MGDKQEQKSGEKSVNLQAGRDIQVGLSYEDAKQIALDVFEANFLELAGEAQKIAEARAKEISDKFLQQLEERNPEAIIAANDPDFQYSLFTVQKEYARTGDRDLGEVLVDILVERAKENQRSLMQIVLNEAIQTAAKLTPDQLDALSIILTARYTFNTAVQSIDTFIEYLNIFFLPFIPNLRKEGATYQHLAYSGCGSISMGEQNLADLFRENYQGLFWKGLSQENIDSEIKNGIDFLDLLIPCFHDEERFQFSTINKEVLEKYVSDRGLSQQEINKLTNISRRGLFNRNEAKDIVIEFVPEMRDLFEVWENSQMKNILLTSVGIAIGHANIRRKTGKKPDLSIWIN